MNNHCLAIFAVITVILRTTGIQNASAQSSDSSRLKTLSYSDTVPYLVGVAAKGGASGIGTIYRISTDGGEVEVLHNFDSLDGARPNGSLLRAADGILFGTTSQGGRDDDDCGTLFKVNSDGTGFDVVIDFDGVIAQNTYGPLIEASDGWLYGMSEGGGSGGFGTVFKIDANGNRFTVLHNFSLGDGGWARNPLMQASNGSLYGMTLGDGGTIFRINTDGSGYQLLRRNAGLSYGSLTEVTDGSLVGMTQIGGGMDGTIGTAVMFRMNPDGSDYSVIYTFHGPSLWFPLGSFLKTDGFLYGTTYYGGNEEFGSIFRINEDGTGFKELHIFGGFDGALPVGGSLIRYKDKLYGTTTFGGLSDNGVIFNFDLITSSYTKMADLNEDTGKYPMLGNFCLIDPVSDNEDFSIVDTRSGEVLKNFNDSVAVDASDPSFGYLTVRVNTKSENPGSVLFRIDGHKKNIENKIPYLLQSRFIRSLSPGRHLLTAEVYTQRRGKGIQQQSMEAVIELVNHTAVERINLVNQEGDKIRELVDGDVLTAGDLQLHNMNIGAILTRELVAGSVQFYLDGMPYHVENSAPYIMFSRNRKWWDQPGIHTVSATPYGNKNGKGVPGGSLMIRFSIIAAENKNSGIAVNASTAEATNDLSQSVSIYPVPVQGTLHVQVANHSDGQPTQLLITNNFSEVLFKTLLDGTESTITLDLDKLGLMRGIYYLQVRTATSNHVMRFLKD